MASCEEDNDFNLLGDGDGDGDADGEEQEEAKASKSKGKGIDKREKRKDLHLPLEAFSLNKKHHKEEETDKEHSNSKRGSTDVYRKDREEWSDGAIEALLDAYTHRFELLNRGNLRGRDWEDVAAAVNLNLNPLTGTNAANTGNTGTTSNRKTVEQCKNKIDNLKKRFKVECHRLSSTSSSSSHWPWFSKLQLIVSNPSSSSHNNSRSQTLSPLPIPILHPPPLNANANDDDGSPSPSASASASASASGRHSKRYAAAALTQAAMRVFPSPRYKWKRVLLKVSGAALAAPTISASSASGPQNVDPKVSSPLLLFTVLL